MNESACSRVNLEGCYMRRFAFLSLSFSFSFSYSSPGLSRDAAAELSHRSVSSSHKELSSFRSVALASECENRTMHSTPRARRNWREGYAFTRRSCNFTPIPITAARNEELIREGTNAVLARRTFPFTWSNTCNVHRLRNFINFFPRASANARHSRIQAGI